MLALWQFLHLAAGVVWGGGVVLLSLAVFPALARMEAAEARALWDRLAPGVTPLLGAAAGLSMVFGLLRAWAGGGLARLADLWSPYGVLLVLALLLVIAENAFGSRDRARLRGLMDDAGRYRAEAPALLRRSGAMGCVYVAAVLVLMVFLGLGHY